MTGSASATPAAPATEFDALALDNLTIQFERQGQDPLAIVTDYELRLQRGGLHCLAGRSGSGKTSILRVAAGLTPPATGRVLWDGLEITGLSDDVVATKRRRHVGYLDQHGNLLPGLTALENVLLPAVPERRTRELARRARDLLGQLGVGGRIDHYPERLSGGERQRVAFARALLLDPPTLMADEPTASLDRESADALIRMLQDLAAQGHAVLVASHDAHLIAAAQTRTQLA